MGEVFEGYDPQLDRPVAIKFPLFDPTHPHHAARVRRFLREAHAAARVRHGNVCPIYDVGEADGRPFVVMALVRGESLAARLSARGGPFEPGETVRVVRRVAAGLAAVHQHGLIHRDIKPGNVLLDGATGEAVLTDFGLARPADDDSRLTADGTIAGTPAYMAPEQAAGEDERLGPATDVYGLGVVLYELLTGQVPFPGGRLSVLKRVINDPPPKPSSLRPDLDRRLEAIVLKAMAKDPGDRYGSAVAFADALKGWRSDGVTVTAEAVAPARRRAGRRLAAALGSAAVLVVGLAGAYWGGLFDPAVGANPAVAPPDKVAAPIALDGELVVTVSSDPKKGPVRKRMVPVDQPGALPVLDGEVVHLRVTLNQPAYAYLIWVDSAGEIQPLYPWDADSSDQGWAAPLRAEGTRARQEFHVPAQDFRGFEVEGPAGLETAVLLARRRPLGDPNILRDLVGKLPTSPMMHPKEVVWIGRGPADQAPRWERDLNRGLKTGHLQTIDAPVVDLLQRGVGKHFELLKAVRFAHAKTEEGGP